MNPEDGFGFHAKPEEWIWHMVQLCSQIEGSHAKDRYYKIIWSQVNPASLRRSLLVCIDVPAGANVIYLSVALQENNIFINPSIT